MITIAIKNFEDLAVDELDKISPSESSGRFLIVHLNSDIVWITKEDTHTEEIGAWEELVGASNALSAIIDRVESTLNFLGSQE